MNIKHTCVLVPALLALLCLQPIIGTAQPGKNFPPVPARPEVKITSLSINSANDDFAPVPLRGGSLLVFTSTRSGMYGGTGDQRVWIAAKQTNGWGAPATANEGLSYAEHIGAAALTMDGNFMIFAAYEWNSGDETLAGSGRTDLYSAEKIGGEWANIQNLGPMINSPYWDSQPSLSADGRLLFFTSDRPGGAGGTDIYVSRLTASGWSAPTNIKEPINTEMDEMSPGIAPDGKSLFFASNGLGGVGGFDLFVAMGGAANGTNWKTVENLGTPINSASDEYFFTSVPNSKNGFFSSSRGGDLDIYLAYPNPFPPESMVTVSGTVSDAETDAPIGASITVTDLSSGEVVATFRSDDMTGDYYVPLTRGRRYSITAEAPDYIFYSDEYTVPPDIEATDVRKNIKLGKVSGGSTRLLVFFDYDKSDLKGESMPDLNRAVNFLNGNPGVRIEIAGHTDSLGSDAYNKTLSQKRSEAVLEYFAKNGVDRGRMKARGYGEEKPIADNGTDEGRARNRRVEMRVQ